MRTFNTGAAVHSGSGGSRPAILHIVLMRSNGVVCPSMTWSSIRLTVVCLVRKQFAAIDYLEPESKNRDTLPRGFRASL